MEKRNVLLSGLFAILLVAILASLASADVIDPRYSDNYHSSYGTSSIYLINITYNGNLIENYSLTALMCYESPTNFQGPNELNISFLDSQNNCHWAPSYSQYELCSSEGIFSGDYSIKGCNFLYRYPSIKESSPYAKFVIFVSSLNKTFISDEETLLKPVNTFSAELLQYGGIKLNRLDNYSFTPLPNREETSPMGILLLPLLTIMIELLVAFIFLKIIKTKKKISRILGFVLLANVISWPIAFIISLTFILFSEMGAIIFAELFAIIFEAFFIYLTNKKFITLKRSFGLSILINIASFVLGLLILILIMY